MNMKKFNEKMSRPKYSKGGYIKKLGNRHYFDDGGIATNATAPGVGGPGNPTNATTTGLGGIAQGLGLNAASANIQNGTNAAQLNNAYQGSQGAINAQVGLTNTLTPQAANGVNAQQQAENQDLAIASGAGPNPAQNELAQATGTNVSNEAALLAGQRGAGANVGLAARNIGQQGAATQQGAVGQAATLGAQQQIAANTAAAGIGANQIGQTQGATTALNTAQQNEQQTLQNANTSANNAAVQMQSNVNNVNSQASQGLLGGIESGASSALGAIGLARGGEVSPHGKHKLEFIHKMAKMGLEHFDGGGQVANPNSPSSMGVPSPVLKAFKFADGGPIQANPLVSGITNAPGSPVIQTPTYNQSATPGGPNIEATPQSNMNLAKSASSGYSAGHDAYMKRGTNAANAAAPGNLNTFNNDLSDGSAIQQDASLAGGGEVWNIHPTQHAAYSANHFSQYFAKGGEAKKVPAMLSPGEVYLPPDAVERVKHGADPLKEGMRVPGKAKVRGDSLKNDIIPATLEEGGVVIDRKNVGHPDKARLFVLKSLRATGKHMKKPGSMN